MRFAVLTLIFAMLASCATHITPGPDLTIADVQAGGIRFVNDTPEAPPRQYFGGGGPVTARTDYRLWTQHLINGVAAGMPKTAAAGRVPRVVTFSILTIDCSGAFVLSCGVTFLVTSDSGWRKVYTTDMVNGYPLPPTLERAVDAGIALVLSDPAGLLVESR